MKGGKILEGFFEEAENCTLQCLTGFFGFTDLKLLMYLKFYHMRTFPELKISTWFICIY